MSDVTKITDYVTKSQARLLLQYLDKDKFKDLIKIFLVQIQEFEDAAYEFFKIFDIDEMVGDNLDVIGIIVGQIRESGWTDETYRVMLKARVGVNISEGKWSDILNVFSILKGSVAGQAWECFPAEVQLFIENTILAVIEGLMVQIMQDVVGGGIKVWGMKYTETNPFVFGWTGEPDPTAKGKGFSWTGSLDQGKLGWTI